MFLNKNIELIKQMEYPKTLENMLFEDLIKTR
jgi:hypothetical protein